MARSHFIFKHYIQDDSINANYVNFFRLFSFCIFNGNLIYLKFFYFSDAIFTLQRKNRRIFDFYACFIQFIQFILYYNKILQFADNKTKFNNKRNIFFIQLSNLHLHALYGFCCYLHYDPNFPRFL